MTGVRRFGKFVSMDTDGLSLVFHLARAGWVRFTDSPTRHPPRKWARGTSRAAVVLRQLRPARDGSDRGRHKEEPGGLRGAGPPTFPASPPWDRIRSVAGFDADTLAEILGASSQQIKGVLRSQSVIAGIGNAYSDEILHAARMSPFAIAKSLDRETVQVFTTPSTASWGRRWPKPRGKPPGELKDTKRSHMRVHARTGEACPVCGDTVREVSFADTVAAVLSHLPDQGKDPGGPADVKVPEVGHAGAAPESRKPRHPGENSPGRFLFGRADRI